MTAPQVLVTGAGGFLGRHIVDALLAAGWRVAALDRAFDQSLIELWRNHAEQLTLLTGEAETLPEMAASAIVHAAALTASPGELALSPEDHLRGNFEPALRALEWAAKRGARAVLVSSSAVFRASAPAPLDETSPANPFGLYAVAKAAAESLAETLRVEYGRDVAVVRLSNIYGPGELPRLTRPRLSLVARLLAQALTTGMIRVYRDDARRDWTFAPDVGRAIAAILAVKQLNHSLYHVASGQLRTSEQVGQAIASDMPDVIVETFAGADPALLPQTRLGILTSQRLLEDVGFSEWTSFEDGIAQTVAWARAQVEVAL